MNFHKIFQYTYLIIAVLFFADAIKKYNANQSPWISFGFTVMAVFMFFFKRNFAKKHEQSKKK